MMKNIYSTFFVLILASFVAVLVIGCAPTIRCEPPNTLVGNRCCLDSDDDGVCDSDEPDLETEIKDLEEVEPEPAGTESEGTTETSEQGVVTGSANKDTESDDQLSDEPSVKTEDSDDEDSEELEPGRYDIELGEPKRYIEIEKLEMHRYSQDKVLLDFLWYTVRNVGSEKLNPEVTIRAEGVRVGDSEYSSTGVEREYILEPLEPGEKEIIKLPMGLRYGGMNKSRTITMKVYERYVAPKEALGESVKEFKPVDELESMEIWWVDKE